MASFIPEDPPDETIYLLASKCHPALFDKLKDRDVRIWHIDDHPLPPGTRAVKGASTITLCVQSLMRRLGYRHFDIYGWDAAYTCDPEGQVTHHASESPLAEYPPGTITVNVGATMIDGEPQGGRIFHTTPTWAAEAQDAIVQLHHADYTVTIHGDGLIKAIRESHYGQAAQRRAIG